MIDFDKFEWVTQKADDSGLISVDDCISISAKYRVVAELDYEQPDMRITFYGFGRTEEEATIDCKEQIIEWSSNAETIRLREVVERMLPVFILMAGEEKPKSGLLQSIIDQANNALQRKQK